MRGLWSAAHRIVSPRTLLGAVQYASPAYSDCVSHFDLRGASRRVAVTIDDAPSDAALMHRTLDALRDAGVTATFFVVANFCRDAERLATLRRAVAEGHELGNHMCDDASSQSMSESEFGRRALRRAHRVRSVDWLVDFVASKTQPGSIILLHAPDVRETDRGKKHERQNNADAFPLFPRLRESFELGSLSDLAAEHESILEAGIRGRRASAAPRSLGRTSMNVRVSRKDSREYLRLHQLEPYFEDAARQALVQGDRPAERLRAYFRRVLAMRQVVGREYARRVRDGVE
ncbi:polysaccharide deacetylase [Aureococcus anophagefferens]|nr:polysaccharide deacetylase [Aureococcus anophagefferens]